MKRNVALILILVLWCSVQFQANANVRLPAIIGNHMVLQQSGTVKLWGWCDAAEKITVSTSWDTTTYTTVGTDEAKWQVAIKTPAAGGPHRITIKGYNTIELEDVMTGEVWLCSGQSNMEWSGNQNLPQSLSEMPNANNKNIRFFHIPRTTARYPQEDVAARWVVSSPEAMKSFSAIGYFFGKELVGTLNAPVGLINASWGGTPAEVWTPEATVTGHEGLQEAATKLEPRPWWPVKPGTAYNGMIAPITPFAIAGALWYQGESNVGTAGTYTPLFSAMIKDWRQAFGKEFPFYFVQIAPFSGYGNQGNSAALLREAQTATLSLPRTGMVLTTDLVDSLNDIHPKMKKEVAERLARMALADTYGKSGIAYQSPRFSRMEIVKNRVRLHFSDGGTRLASKGGAPKEFYIAGADKVFYPAQAKVEGNTVMVWSKSVPQPEAVRFAFTNAPQPNLYSEAGLPVAPFRTDNWDVTTLPAQ